MKVSEFDYDLPESYIAQIPIEPRDASRLMLLGRETREIGHTQFNELGDFLFAGDVLVFNTTRVIPARLTALRANTGGKAEILLLRRLNDSWWRALVGGKRAATGTIFVFPDTDVTATVIAEEDHAERIIEFSQPINGLLHTQGQIPLPPYIHEPLADSERYQTVYSREEGSAAAPTAGLHFTADLLLQLRNRGIRFAYCTLHVGLDTFQPVRVEEVSEHHIHSEYAVLTAENARIINEAKLAGGRIISVGTTAARTIETAGILSEGGDPANPYADFEACPWRPVTAFEGDTKLFIYPGYRWRAVDGLITNFHLPRSTLLMMVSAFAGRENIQHAYEIAKQEQYRFFSFGDAMFIYSI